MSKAYALKCCCYETNASRCGFGACVLLPLCILTAFAIGLINGPTKPMVSEPKITVLKIMPTPPAPKPIPIEEYSPIPIEPMAPLEAPKPKPAPVEQPKPKPAPQVVDNPAPSPPQETYAPVQAQAAPNVGPEPVKAAGPPQVEAGMSPSDYDRFLSDFLAQIRQELVYPKAAQRANIEGSVKVSIDFNSQGQVTGYRLLSGSYHKMLGEAAEKTIVQVQKSWKPPIIPGKAQTIVVPVVFELK